MKTDLEIQKEVRERFPFYTDEQLFGLYRPVALGKMFPVNDGKGRRIGRCRSYVYAMKSGGYQFTDGDVTTLMSALCWLQRNPAFKATSANATSSAV
jgi:hypothetical protein